MIPHPEGHVLEDNNYIRQHHGRDVFLGVKLILNILMLN